MNFILPELFEKMIREDFYRPLFTDCPPPLPAMPNLPPVKRSVFRQIDKCQNILERMERKQ